MNNDGLPGANRKYVSPETQARREIAALKKAVKAEIKLAKLKAKAGNLRSLLKDIEDAKADRISSFDIMRAFRTAVNEVGAVSTEVFHR